MEILCWAADSGKDRRTLPEAVVPFGAAQPHLARALCQGISGMAATIKKTMQPCQTNYLRLF